MFYTVKQWWWHFSLSCARFVALCSVFSHCAEFTKTLIQKGKYRSYSNRVTTPVHNTGIVKPFICIYVLYSKKNMVTDIGHLALWLYLPLAHDSACCTVAIAHDSATKQATEIQYRYLACFVALSLSRQRQWYKTCELETVKFCRKCKLNPNHVLVLTLEPISDIAYVNSISESVFGVSEIQDLKHILICIQHPRC